MVTTPVVTPTTTPVEELTVAILLVPLVHVPPVVASVSVPGVPTQSELGPVMGSTCANEVTHSISASKVSLRCFIKSLFS